VAGPKFSFDMLDADGDGRITRSEYEAAFKVCKQEQLYQHLGMRLQYSYLCVCIYILTHVSFQYIYVNDI